MPGDRASVSVITKIELQKNNKHRFNIYLDEAYAFSIHEDILIKHRLLKGQLISEEELRSVLLDEERNGAYLKALRFLGARPRTNKEVRQKLQAAGYEEAVIEETVRRLESERYVDDRQFAKQWTEHRLYSQNKGKAFIRQELLQKGVGREHIQEALQGIEWEDELSSAVEIGAKKWRQTSGETFDRKRKTAAFLLRRGFSSDVVQQALRKINEVND
jgi:regulatory protein